MGAKRILFVCTGNSCRSVMAEALFRKISAKKGRDFLVQSAGVSALDGFPASAETVRVMKDEEGLDVTDHMSQRLRPEMVQEADHIFVMERLHRDWIVRMDPSSQAKVRLLSEYAPEDDLGQEDIPDPIRMSPSFYKNVLGVIRRCVEKAVTTL